PTLVVFQAGVSASDTHLERLVAEAQNAATLDLLLTAAQTNAFHSAILVTEDPTLATSASNLPLSNLPLHIQPATEYAIRNTQYALTPFHFGQNLLRICQEHRLERVVYVGGGAMPLATPHALADLVLSVSGAGESVISNNLFSADLVAFYPASALERIDMPASDNDLAWLLHYRAGLPHAATVKSLATHFDLDTPTDLATLRHSTLSAPLDRALSPHMAAFLKRVPLELPALEANVERAYKVMATRRAQVFLAGRVSSWTWRRMEINLPCQTRILSEERGMRASGRESSGAARSLLGLYTDLAGISGLISALEATSDAAFLDTRVLFAHMGLKPARPDRFASDALLPSEIADPWLRELTEAASNASIPIVLGGHSLIAGGMWALSEQVRGSASSAAS
ncbi:MAG: hypothetical protein WCD37_14620, partial [Chloroflexia bacterium]